MTDDNRENPVAAAVAGMTHDAPFVFFDNAPTVAHLNGLICVSLSAAIWLPTDDGRARVEQLIVAHLRTNIPGAIALRDAINNGLLLAMPPSGDQTN
jgi:hypothetical protein